MAGLGVPTMASLNAMLGNKLDNTLFAVVILTGIAFLVSTVVMLSMKGFPEKPNFIDIPWHLYFGGALFIIYIVGVTWVIPKFGVANTIGCVLLGQLIAMTLLDHFGAFGLEKYQITPTRLIGLSLMAAGILVVVTDRN